MRFILMKNLGFFLIRPAFSADLYSLMPRLWCSFYQQGSEGVIFQRWFFFVKLVWNIKLPQIQIRQRKRKLTISVSIIIILRPLFWTWFISLLFVPRRALRDHSRLKPQILNYWIYFYNLTLFCRKKSHRAQNRIYITSQQLSEMLPTKCYKM